MMNDDVLFKYEERQRIHTLELDRMSQNWVWALTLGISLTLLGFGALAFAGIATLSSIFVFGSLLVLGGIAQLGHAVFIGKGRYFFLNLLVGFAYTATGLLMLARPAEGAMSVTLLIAAFLLVSGLVRIVWSFGSRLPHAGWSFFGGMLTAILGLLVGLSWPESSLWMIGIFLGFEMITSGIAWSLMALSARDFAKGIKISGKKAA